ncbi:unnamed protein product [Clonostachys chloroleuca]|uniref:DUF7730 domain-containing protein n=1 Tax=Clonostachys chloroleuca TaxID=1926264 RepID=A0AA35M8H2_9HYPO|nr:unnamed protein product [Clonostachys chloroleuca]
MDPAPSPFLALPAQIRKRIYRFAHLLRPCPILMVPRSRAVADSPAGFPGPFCRSEESASEGALECHMLLGQRKCTCPAIPKQLLLINKALHRETLEVLYGENTFAICAHEVEDFEAFRMLSNDALHALRRLVVRWNSMPFIHAHNYNNGSCLICQAPVSLLRSESMFPEWKLVCQLLARGLAPVHLRLDLIVNVQDSMTIHRIFASSYCLPRLLDCNIWMGRPLDPHMTSFACLTAQYLLSKPSPEFEREPRKSQTPLTLLPLEIRRRILMFTNLRYNGPFLTKAKEICVKDGKFAPSPSPECMHGTCTKCSTTAVRCLCRYGLEWQSFSPHCQCRDLPVELFRVSWQMYADGAEVLYSTNIFTFSGSFLNTLKMLQSFRPETLKLFRRIRFEFDFEQTKAWDKQETSFLSLFSFIGRHFDVSQLLLIIDTSNDYYPCLEREFGEPTMKNLYDAYISIMRWVKFSLPGLTDLHVVLGIFLGLETEFEKYVMGPQYDSKRGNRYAKAAHSFDVISPAIPNWREVSEIPNWHRPL